MVLPATRKTAPSAASRTEAAGLAGVKESLALLTAGAQSFTKAMAKVGTAKEPQLAALASQIAAQVALITAANTALQAAAAPAPAAS